MRWLELSCSWSAVGAAPADPPAAAEEIAEEAAEEAPATPGPAEAAAADVGLLPPAGGATPAPPNACAMKKTSD